MARRLNTSWGSVSQEQGWFAPASCLDHLLSAQRQSPSIACKGQACTRSVLLSWASELSQTAAWEQRTAERVPLLACQVLMRSCTHPPEPYRVNDLPKRRIIHLQNTVDCEAMLPQAQHGS